MSKKKIAVTAAAAVIVVAAALVWILWPSHPYTCRIALRDANGGEVTDLTKLSAGDIVSMTAEVEKEGRDEAFEAYGLEITVTVSGVSYNGGGTVFSENAAVTGKKQTVAETETVSFMYMDLTREGMSMANPLTVGECTFTVTDPANAEVRLTTALIYPTDHTKGYEIIQGK